MHAWLAGCIPRLFNRINSPRILFVFSHLRDYRSATRLTMTSVLSKHVCLAASWCIPDPTTVFCVQSLTSSIYRILDLPTAVLPSTRPCRIHVDSFSALTECPKYVSLRRWTSATSPRDGPHISNCSSSLGILPLGRFCVYRRHPFCFLPSPLAANNLTCILFSPTSLITFHLACQTFFLSVTLHHSPFIHFF